MHTIYRQQPGRLISFLILASFLLLSAPGKSLADGSVTVIVSASSTMDYGRESAREKALSLALRRAVEQGLGTMLSSTTIVEKNRLISDRVYSRASGYVLNYTVLSEGVKPDQSQYEITLEAVVSTASISDDLRAIGILSDLAGNPAFLSVRAPLWNTPNKASSRVVETGRKAINSVFASKGFPVLDAPHSIGIFTGQPDRDGFARLSQIARQTGAGLLLIFDVLTTPRITGFITDGILIEVRLRAVNASTRELITQKTADKYVHIGRGITEDALDLVAVTGVDEVGRAAAEAALSEVLAYFERQVQGGRRNVVELRGFGDREALLVAEVLQGIPGVVSVSGLASGKEGRGFAVYYLGEELSLRNEAANTLRSHSICVNVRKGDGSAIVLEKARCAGK